MESTLEASSFSSTCSRMACCPPQACPAAVAGSVRHDAGVQVAEGARPASQDRESTPLRLTRIYVGVSTQSTRVPKRGGGFAVGVSPRQRRCSRVQATAS